MTVQDSYGSRETSKLSVQAKDVPLAQRGRGEVDTEFWGRWDSLMHWVWVQGEELRTAGFCLSYERMSFAH